ncbi:DUF4251 domain-containing protein [Mucilaginibacter sp.]|uniref:DUF4251 domain-containing protein n=1 Tax=Mucilaginibacter sp. TaxID=1882438 RepID=UPI0025E7D532|nr:DUF4251 domain-containing protein [Mucilaginibacter sp.]
MKKLTKLAIVSVLILSCFQTVLAQKTSRAAREAAKVAKVKALIDAQNYVFQADYVIPQRGNSKSLTFGYDMVVSKDTLQTYLPYYGQVTLAPTDASDGGIKLNTTNFSYEAKAGKKGGYEIIIKLKDNFNQGSKDVRYMRLQVSATGYASLQVISNNRDPISFNGTIEDRKEKK